MFKYYLNNVLVNDPSNWFDFSEILEYNIEENSFLYTYPLALEWSGGSAYAYLIAQSDTDNCNYVELKVEQQKCGVFDTIFIGNIFLADITINRTKCTVKCPVQDNGFTAFLNNNKNIEVQIIELPATAPYNESKNGVTMNTMTITPAMVDLFDVVTGAYQGYYATQAFYIYDCFKYVIGYLSDMKMDFESNFLDRTLPFTTANTNVKRLVLTNGGNIYYGWQNTSYWHEPFTTLSDLLKEVARFYQIGYYVRYDFNGRPTFVLEDLDYFLNTNTSVAFTKVSNVEEKRATEVYYSKINIGGNFIKKSEDPAVYNFEEYPLYTWGNEAYIFSGVCNLDKTLDLTGSYYVDCNTIESIESAFPAVADAAFSSLNDSNFFIEVLNTPTPSLEKAYKIANTNNAFFHYNENLINSNVLERFNDFGDIEFLGENSGTATPVPLTVINTSPKKYKKTYSFVKAINDTDYKSIKNNPTYKIQINIDNNGTLDYGWIKRIERKFATGESQIELRAE